MPNSRFYSFGNEIIYLTLKMFSRTFKSSLLILNVIKNKNKNTHHIIKYKITLNTSNVD